jgi:preprotein translocase subunit SecE
MAVEGNIKKTKEPAKKRDFFKFFRELKAEAKRITWASKKEVKKSTIAVLSFFLIYVVIVGILDFGFNNLFQLIFK